MSKIFEDKKYTAIVENILFNSNFVKLKNDDHHGSNKYDHCRRVSYISYKIARILHCDYVATARAGLLHDFFYGTRKECNDNSYLRHPITSARNAKKYFNINKKEESIIRTHMFHQILLKRIFPFINRKERAKVWESKPTCIEGWLVCLTDMFVAFYELLLYKIKNNLKYLYTIGVIRAYNYIYA